MTPREAAERLGYRSVRYVRTMIAAGVLKATKLPVFGRTVYYDVTEEDLAEFRLSYHPKQRGKPRGKRVQ